MTTEIIQSKPKRCRSEPLYFDNPESKLIPSTKFKPFSKTTIIHPTIINDDNVKTLSELHCIVCFFIYFITIKETMKFIEE